jgi:hypothetical protein
MVLGGEGGYTAVAKNIIEVKVKNKIDFQTVMDRAEEAIKYALWRQGQAVIAQAQQDRLVPIDTGTLRRSAVITFNEPPDFLLAFSSAAVKRGETHIVLDKPKLYKKPVNSVYVSYNTPYAAHLHESLSWKPHREGGPKWIERALAAVKGKFNEIAANAVRKVWERNDADGDDSE